MKNYREFASLPSKLSDNSKLLTIPSPRGNKELDHPSWKMTDPLGGFLQLYNCAEHVEFFAIRLKVQPYSPYAELVHSSEHVV